MWNRKAQYYMPPPKPYRGLSPILILAMIIIAIPLVSVPIGYEFPRIMKTIFFVMGGVGLIVGVAHTIYNKFNNLPGDCF